VHLAGQADTHDRLGSDAALGEHRANRLLTGTPPVLRILFRPGRLRRRERRVIRGRGREEGAVLAQQQRARTARADVNA
jgi:hypothetical protein